MKIGDNSLMLDKHPDPDQIPMFTFWDTAELRPGDLFKEPN